MKKKLSLLAFCLLLTGCPEKIILMPEIGVDYGYGEPDTSTGVDTNVTDLVLPDTTFRDNGAEDTGPGDVAADVTIDTGPCTLLCPAYVLCGPHPCGEGECEPGCSGSKPVCNLETRKCEPETCVPQCGTRECGYDGCGGTCGELDGKCPPGEHCNYTDGTCGTQCYPDCTGKLCGDNGCGGICSPGCPAGVECHADGYCVNEGQCQASSSELKCAIDENSGGGSTAWNIGTTTMSLFNYSAACGSMYNPGPEKAFRLQVEAGVTGVLQVKISQSLPLLANFLNVYLLEDTGAGCLAADCVAWGGSGKTFQYEVPSSPTGHTYYLVADAGERNDGTFSITIEKCTWNGFDASAGEAAATE